MYNDSQNKLWIMIGGAFLFIAILLIPFVPNLMQSSPTLSINATKVNLDTDIESLGDKSLETIFESVIPDFEEFEIADRDFAGYGNVTLIPNGNFSNGTTGFFTTGYQASFQVVNGIAETTDFTISSRSFLTNVLPVVSGHKYYWKFQSKIDNLSKLSNAYIMFGLSLADGGSSILPTETMNEFQGIGTFTTGNQLRLYFSFIEVGVYKAFLDDLILVDLNAIYTSGIISSIPTTVAEFEALVIHDELDLNSCNLIQRVDSNNSILATPVITPLGFETTETELSTLYSYYLKLLNSESFTNEVNGDFYSINKSLYYLPPMITAKQYSPLYHTTFDLLTDVQIKTQMDDWYYYGLLE